MRGGIHKMELVKVKETFYTECVKHNTDQELMFNEQGRPCVLMIRMKYRDKYYKFVVPLRSNISGATPKNQYFSLPPNANTKKGNSHGLHFIKIFPVTEQYIDKYLIDKSSHKLMIKSIIDKNEETIINECQNYLESCEQGKQHYMTPNIDGILAWLYPVDIGDYTEEIEVE